MVHKDHEYLISWTQIIVGSSKTSTLKYALACALIEFTKENRHQINSISISKEEIAKKLINYYWFQVIRFRLRQAPREIQDPKIVTLLKSVSEIAGPYVRTPKDISIDLMQPIINELIEHGLREVLPRFHRLRNGQTTRRLFFERRSNAIVIPKEAEDFVYRHSDILRSTVLYEWTIWLEKFNSAPKIATKVAFNSKNKRSSLSKYRRLLLPIQGYCFYCNAIFASTPHVDHVIPWSYLLEDNLWNLVLACNSCNSSKGNNLPHKIYIEKLINRNQEIIEGETHFAKDMTRTLEIITKGDLSQISVVIETICEQARLAGFADQWHALNNTLPA